MISVKSEKIGTKSKTRIQINFNVEEVTCELYQLLKCMLDYDPYILHTALDKLMTEITESSYDIDPEKFEEYRLLLEDIE